MAVSKIDESDNEFEQFVMLRENANRLFELIDSEIIEKVWENTAFASSHLPQHYRLLCYNQHTGKLQE